MNTPDTAAHSNEPHFSSSGQTLNWLRAAVLGANDGIMSVAAIIVGVAGAYDSLPYIVTSGVAGLLAGALSMAVGEYVSVSTQRDTEKALLEKERYELEHQPEFELEELTTIYQKKGLTRTTAEIVAKELTATDAFAAHVDAELGINPHDLTNPWHAALASGVSFCIGAVIPLFTVMLAPAAYRIHLTFFAVFIALVITGTLSAYMGDANKTKATIRVVLGGVVAMAVTFGIGALLGVKGL